MPVVSNPGMYNNEPGADLFNTMVFGNVDNVDVPNNIEDPFISYAEDAKEYEQFVVESDKRFNALLRKLNQLQRDQYINRSLAVECAAVMPNFLEKRRIESFTMTPSRTNYHYACESVHWAVWGLVAAGIAALVALGWKLYRTVTDSSSDNTGSPGSGPMSESETAAAAKKASDKAEAKIERREKRTKTYAEIKASLAELVGNQDGVVKITEANTSKEIMDALDSKYKKEDGVQIDMTAINALLLAMYPNEGSREYALMNGVAVDSGMFITFHKPEYGSSAQNHIAALSDHFSEVYKQLDEILKLMIDVNGANPEDLRNATDRAKALMLELDTRLKRNTDGQQNKSAISTTLFALESQLKVPANTARLGAQDINKILDTVDKPDGQWMSLYKKMSELIFTGDNCLTKSIGLWMLKIEDLHKRVSARVEKNKGVAHDKATEEGRADTNRDSQAMEMKNILERIRDALSQAKEAMQVGLKFNKEIEQLDDCIARMLINLLKTLQRIYKDNGKQTNKFVELANAMTSSLGGGQNVFS